MTSSVLTPASLEALRAEFDASFRATPADIQTATRDYLVLRAGGVRYAVALSEVALLDARIEITRLPASHPALLGICGARGQLLAVYDLATSVGVPKASSASPWLLRVAGTTLAFAFDGLESHVRLTSEAESQGCIAVGELTIPVLALRELASSLTPQPNPASRHSARKP